MKRAILTNFSPFNKLFFTSMLVICSLLIFFLFSALMAIPLFGVNIFSAPEILRDFTDEKALLVNKYFQIIQSIGLFIVPAMIASYLFNSKSSEYLGISKKPDLFSLIVAGIVMIVSIPLVNWLLQINEMLTLPETMHSIEEWIRSAEEERIEISEAFLEVSTFSGFLINLLMFGVIAAIGEELLFRGLVLRLLHEWFRNAHVAVILSALLFAVLHLQFFSLLPRIGLGVLMGYLYVWTRSIWVPILVHFVNNASAVVVFYLVNIGYLKLDVESFGTTDNVYFLIISTIAVTFLVASIYFREKKLRPT